MSNFIPLSITDRLSLSMHGLRVAVAERIVGSVLSVAVMTLIYFRLLRIENRVLWLIAAIREGRVRGGWVCPGRASVVRAKGLRPPAVSWPRGFAWLCGVVPYKAAGFGSQLAHLFGDPEMVALLAASPQLRRALRPLCRMLGIEPALVAPVAPVAPDASEVFTADVVSGGGGALPVVVPGETLPGYGARGDPLVGLGSVVTEPGQARGGGFCELV